MWRPVQWRSRNATTSACVGWDFHNIENRLTFRKQARRSLLTAGPRQNGLTTTKITIPIMRIVGTSLIKR
jgi:hypothetical protein